MCRVDTQANTVTLGDNADLMSTELRAVNWNWIAGAAPIEHPGTGTAAGASTNPDAGADMNAGASADATAAGFRASAKVRYHQPDQPCQVIPQADGSVRIIFDAPQRAATPGQAVVVYRGDELLGGGTIV